LTFSFDYRTASSWAQVFFYFIWWFLLLLFRWGSMSPHDRTIGTHPVYVTGPSPGWHVATQADASVSWCPTSTFIHVVPTIWFWKANVCLWFPSRSTC
jgi:hypothetical protein